MRTGTGDVTLVIGTEAQTICEGFPADEVSRAIREIRPAQVVLVGDIPADACRGVPCRRAEDLAEGTALAAEMAGDGIIVLAVKTWR
ncbi:MAG: hypothetical protein GKC04_07965 [Methanomicrobiales archaeon]|nr:hypothetical protein [Methanomicrobiales archaeon]